MVERDPSTLHWSPPGLLYASAALHLAAAAAVMTRPATWPWALGAVAANHALLTATGLWPRSHWLGPNMTSLPAARRDHETVAITIDDGPEPDVTPRVLEILAEHGATATFFCIGEKVERHAELAREIVRRGHSIENHSQRHRHNFSLLGPGAMRAEIAHAQGSIARVTGSTPRFFRAPAGLRNPFLDFVLAKLDLRLASWTRRGFDTVKHDADAVLHRLADPLAPGDILLLHDGHAARSSSGQPVIIEVLPRLLEAMAGRRLKPIGLRAVLSCEAP